MQRIAIFIDGPNTYSAARSLDMEIDYRRVLQLFDKEKLLRAFYFTPVAEGDDFSTIRPLLDWLDYNGYRLVTKPQRTDPENKRRVSMDVDIAVSMMEMADHVQRIFLFSGDSNLIPAVLSVQRKGVHVTVISTLKGQSGHVSDELRRAADHFYDLADFSSQIARVERGTKSSTMEERYGIRS